VAAGERWHIDNIRPILWSDDDRDSFS
jgi:hypothetical protein